MTISTREKTRGGIASYAKSKLLNTWANVWCAFRILATPRHTRYLLRWLRSLRKKPSSRAEPWLTFGAIDFLSGLSLSGKRVFEYGSGMSTLFWVRQGAHCVSVEHDAGWYERIKPLLETESRVDYRFVPPQRRVDSGAWDPADPHLFVSSDEESSGLEFKNYVTQIDEFPSEFFDIILIDGRARPSCIEWAHGKVKRGGILVLDNSDREYYLRNTGDLLAGFKPIVFTGPTPGSHVFSETSVFIRMKSV